MNEKHQYDDEELLKSIANGDERAFTLFFEAHQSRVFTITHYFTQSPERAEDLVQDVFMKIWKDRLLLPEVKNPANWVATVARNFSLNDLKRKAREQVKHENYEDYIPSVTDPSGHLLFLEDVRKYLSEALEHLTAQQRTVFELSRLEGLNRQEIAEKLNLSPNTVKMHLLRSSKFVRAFLFAKLDHLLLFAFFFCFYKNL